ncbi:MAG: GIY-YIG nuclease family protein [Candidatus Firestonebacteria bacterium]
MKDNRKRKSWYVYILRCADKTLYTGITNDVKKRVKAHNEGKGAKYTRGRAPVEIVYKKRFTDKSAASKEEAKIKRLNKKEKLKIIKK